MQERFGQALACNAQYVAIGAPSSKCASSTKKCGQVYVYSLGSSGFTSELSLVKVAGADAGAMLGYSLTIAATLAGTPYVLAGAYQGPGPTGTYQSGYAIVLYKGATGWSYYKLSPTP